jgi:ABC-type cobalamin/Fe3+-siderophores transport system ATPase subunit
MTTKATTQKKVIFSAGGKGGGGKSTLMASLADFLHSENCPVTLIDCDIENKVHGSLTHFFNQATKVDITTPHGFDEFVDKVLGDNAPMVLADLGAGSGKYTFKWFDDMYEPMQEAGVSFLTVGVVTTEVATTETVFNWANALKARTQYLVVRNHRNGSDFSALESSEPGQKFLKLSKAPIIDMEARLEDIQREMDFRGLSLRQALDAPPEVAGPLLSRAICKIRMRGYLLRMDAQFRRVIETILP